MAVQSVAFISTMERSPWGGCEELWAATAARLLQAGCSVHANVQGWPQEIPQLADLERAGCRIHRRWGPSRWGGPLGRAAGQAVWNYRNRTAKERWLEETRANLVVISQGGNTDGMEWGLACARQKIPYVLLAQAASDTGWPDDAASCREAYEGAEACCFVSHANATLTGRQIGATLKRVRVVRNPFKVSYDAAPPWPHDDGVVRLACVARLEVPSKGQDLLLQIMNAEKWRARSLHLTLVGQGPNEDVLRRLSDIYRLKNVTFGGFATDIERVWAQHHALILPSRMEGLPLALVEAMLCGRSCIVTDVAGNAELLEDNVTGFVAAAPTVRFVDEAMERAWDRRTELRAMGLRAASEVRKHVPADAAGDFMRLLTGLVNGTQCESVALIPVQI